MNPKEQRWTTSKNGEHSMEIKAGDDLVGTFFSPAQTEEHVRRIVASVNIFRWVPVEWLEKADMDALHARMNPPHPGLDTCLIDAIKTIQEIIAENFDDRDTNEPIYIREIDGVCTNALWQFNQKTKRT